MKIKSIDKEIANKFLQKKLEDGTFENIYKKVVLENATIVEDSLYMNILGVINEDEDDYSTEGSLFNPPLKEFEEFSKRILRDEKLKKLVGDGN